MIRFAFSRFQPLAEEQMKKEKRGVTASRITTVNRHAAGLDVGSTFHVVAVPPDRDDQPVRTFKSFTADLHALADWLGSLGITSVAMESTGIYWVPVYEILERRGFEVLLVNARDSKNVPGRKTDVNDAQWLQQLHQHGLLRGSFRPRDELVRLRAYMRHRERLLEQAASYIQRMQKALMQMNVQLHHAVSDITGLTGLRIIRDIVNGQHDPSALAQHRDPRCKASLSTIEAALSGNYREEHVLALRHSLELYDFHHVKVRECDVAIEQALVELNKMRPAPEKPLPKTARPKKTNAPAFDVNNALYTMLGADLSQVHGLGPHSVLILVSECGDDMSKWPTVKHFTSWLCLAPGSKISGGKVLSSRTRPTTSRAANLFRMAALGAGRTQTALGAFYRRLAARAGKAKAITATARKIAVLFYNTLRFGMNYVDPGQDYYEQRYRQRALANLQRRARDLGFALVENAAATPDGGVS
jgi:transposase